MTQQALDEYGAVVATRPSGATIRGRLTKILFEHNGLAYREVCKIYRSKYPDHVGFYDDTLKRHLRTLREKHVAMTVSPAKTNRILWYGKASIQE